LNDYANAIAIDRSSNVYVTGFSDGGPGVGPDYATVKYDSSGQEQWVARYNGPANDDDESYAITVDASGNVYVTGYSVGSGTQEDYATIKYDGLGTEEWVARYDGPANLNDDAHAIALDSSGNVYVTGWSVGLGTGFDYATVKYDSSGEGLWVARYDGAAGTDDQSYAVAVDASGNVCVTGYSTVDPKTGLTDYTTIKYAQAPSPTPTPTPTPTSTATTTPTPTATPRLTPRPRPTPHPRPSPP
jgi:Beta-propeller repeat